MLKKKIRHYLIETKEKKEQRLIIESLINSRLSMVVENVRSLKDFNKLSKDKKTKLSFKLLEELSFLNKNGLLVEEDFKSILTSIYGNSFENIVETLFEPFVEKVLSGLGFDKGYMKNFLVSYLTSKQSEIVKSFSDCKLLTKLISEGIIESIVKTSQENKGFTGFGYDLIRNTMGDVVRNVEFVNKIEEKVETVICPLISKFTKNAQSVAEKLKPSAN
jgi:hypothetical protein